MSKKISISNLKKFEECNKKYHYANVLNLKEKYAEIFQLINEIQDDVVNAISTNNFKSIYDTVENKLSTAKNDWFDSLIDKEQTLKFYKDIFFRYLKFEENTKRAVIDSNIFYKTDITIGNSLYIATGKVDLIVKNKDCYEAIKIEQSQPVLSSRARKIENKPEYDLELALMYKVLKEKYPGIKVSYYHLKNKDDKKYEIVDTFNNKRNKNIVSAIFDDAKLDIVLKRIEQYDLSSTDKNEKNCSFCSYKKLCNNNTFCINEQNDLPVKKLYARPLFNKKQQIVVNHTYGPMRVVAGAGSGKTTTLLYNFVNMVKSHIDPTNILFLTFTNKAAEEIEQRLKVIAENENININGITINTYNGFGYDILKNNSKMLGYNSIKLLSKLELYKLFKNMIMKYPIPVTNYSKYNLYQPNYGLFSKLKKLYEIVIEKNLLDNYSLFKSTIMSMFKNESQILPIYNGLKWVNEERKNKGLITYSEQIILVNKLFAKYPNILELYRTKFKFIRVDEFQDTDPEQMKMVYSIAHNNDNLIVVGDDDQSIYTWRNADNSNLLQFHKYFNCEDVILEKNYRSNKSIIDYANYVISHNSNRFGKILDAVKNDNSKPIILQDNMQIIPQLIKTLLFKKYSYSDIAVIGRKNKELNQCYSMLNAAHIPCNKPQNYLIENPVFNLIVDALSYILDDDINDIALYNMLKLYGINEEDLINKQGCSLHNYLCCNNNKAYLDFIEKINNLCFIKDIKQIILKILEIYNLNAATNKAVLDNLYCLIDGNKISTLYEFYNLCQTMITIHDDTTIEPICSNSISLLTAHGSKGKEFRVIIILGTNFNYVPADEFEEEQRRLFFVALTRAKERLIILDYDRNKKRTSLINELPA